MELTEAAISINNLHVQFKNRIVLDQTNVEFPPGKFSVLLGINGSGKSSLFRIIAGLSSNYEGTVLLKGVNVNDFTNKKRAATIGFLPQHHSIVFPFTVEQILLTGRVAFSGFSPTKKDHQLLENVLEELGLLELRKRQFNSLSGGEQQMVMIARIMMQNPDIILLDEPTNHLDVYYQEFLLRKVKDFCKQGKSVVSIMHNPTLAFYHSDYVYLLNQGKIHSHEEIVKNDFQLLNDAYRCRFIRVQSEGHTIIMPANIP